MTYLGLVLQVQGSACVGLHIHTASHRWRARGGQVVGCTAQQGGTALKRGLLSFCFSLAFLLNSGGGANQIDGPIVVAQGRHRPQLLSQLTQKEGHSSALQPCPCVPTRRLGSRSMRRPRTSCARFAFLAQPGSKPPVVPSRSGEGRPCHDSSDYDVQSPEQPPPCGWFYKALSQRNPRAAGCTGIFRAKGVFFG
jgi:hypothetical protein